MIKVILHTFFLFVLITICLASTSVFAEQLSIPGTGASEVILQELATAFNAENPGSEVVVPPKHYYMGKGIVNDSLLIYEGTIKRNQNLSEILYAKYMVKYSFAK